MKPFSAILLSFLVTVMVIGCASNVKFNVRDRATGLPINNYSIVVDDKKYSSGETAQLNRAVWKNYSAKIEADGYAPSEHQIKKEVIPELLIGGIIFWPAWGWCYGPSDVQDIYLSNTDPTEQTPMISENAAGSTPVR